MDERLYWRFIDMANVRRRLSGFTPRNNSMRINKAEGVNNHFPFHRLDRIDDYCNRSTIQSFKWLKEGIRTRGKEDVMDKADLLSINIHAW